MLAADSNISVFLERTHILYVSVVHYFSRYIDWIQIYWLRCYCYMPSRNQNQYLQDIKFPKSSYQTMNLHYSWFFLSLLRTLIILVVFTIPREMEKLRAQHRNSFYISPEICIWHSWRIGLTSVALGFSPAELLKRRCLRMPKGMWEIWRVKASLICTICWMFPQGMFTHIALSYKNKSRHSWSWSY